MRPVLIAAALATATLALAAPASAQFPGYEELARTTALTAADDYRIGKGYMDMVKWMYGELDDPTIQQDVEQVVRKIVAASDRPDMVFNVIVVPDPTVNAAALPGGFLMINKGLLDGLTPDEVAFVLAHEISHVQLRHFATTMNMTSAMDVLSTGEAAHASGDAGGLGGAYEELSRMATRYNRTLELEADLYGLLYAMRAGYPAQSGVDAMESMKLLVGEVPEWMADDSSHPTFSMRVTELKAGTETVTETYALFDAGVAWARAGDYEAAIPAFQQFLTLFPKSSAGWSNLGTCYLHEAVESFPEDPWKDDLPLYLKADITVRGGPDKLMLDRARDAFTRALAIDPNRDAALGNMGVLARLEGDYVGAEAMLSKALELDPDYPGYMNNLGNVHAASGDLKKADKWWGKALKADPDVLYAKANRAQGYVKVGKKKKKDAIALYQQLEGKPGYSQLAHEALVVLGAKPADSQPVDVPGTDKKPEDEQLLVMLSSLEGDGDPVDIGSLEPAPAEPAPEPAPTPAPTGSQDDSKAGNIGLGMDFVAMVAMLGAPTFKDEQDDGYFIYASWWEAGLSATFADEQCTSMEIFPPGETKTSRGVYIGSTEQELKAAYGEPDAVFGDRNAGYEAWNYDALGHAFYVDEKGIVVSISIWSN